MSDVFGHVDGFSGAYLNGWAATGRPDRHCQVEVIDACGECVATGIAANPRDDLTELPFGRRDLGFSIPLTFGEGALLRVIADGTELPGSPIAIGADRFDGYFEVAGGIAHGWISRRSDSQAPLSVSLRLADGTEIGRGHCLRAPGGADAFFRPYRFQIPLDAICIGRTDFAVTLFADGHQIGGTIARIALDGFLDAIAPDHCSGWLLCPNVSRHDLAMRPLSVTAYRNGHPIGTSPCDLPRADLRARYPRHWQCGFSIRFDRTHVDGAALSRFSLRLDGTDNELLGGPFVIGSRMAFVAAGRQISAHVLQAPPSLPAAARALFHAAMADVLDARRAAGDYQWVPAAAIDAGDDGDCGLGVLLRLHRDVARAEACIRGARESLGARDHLVLIVDGPPEPGMHALLDRYRDLDGVTLLEGDSLARGLALCRGGDVLLLAAGTRLHPGGLDEMRRVLHAAPDIATVTAMSNDAGLFSYPHPSLAGARPDHADPAELAGVALHRSRGLALDVPTGHGTCLLIRRALLDRLGRDGIDDVDAFCARAGDLGFRHVAAAGAFVQHDRDGPPDGDDTRHFAFPESFACLAEHERRDGLRAGRWPLDSHRLTATRAAGIRYALTVENWLEGGTSRAAADIAALPGYGDRWVMRLACTQDGLMQLECGTLRLKTSFASDEHTALLAMLDAADIDLVIFHQLLGFDAATIRALGDWSRHRNAIGYIHDFYAICPRTTLIDCTRRYCGTATPEICTRCVAVGGPHPASRLGALTVPEHRDLFAGFLGAMTTVVTPSRDTAFHLHKVLPTLRIAAIGHPDRGDPYPAKMRTGRRSTILLLGAIGPHKGIDRLLDLTSTALLTHPHLHFTVVGHTSQDADLRRRPNVVVTGRYQPAELSTLLSGLDASLALFLHIWPETFSYTLSEAVQAGFLPVVPDIGAPAERVRDAGFGVIFPADSGSRDILALLDHLAARGSADNPHNFTDTQSVAALRGMMV